MCCASAKRSPLGLVVEVAVAVVVALLEAVEAAVSVVATLEVVEVEVALKGATGDCAKEDCRGPAEKCKELHSGLLTISTSNY
jgi:hypothetical protein